MQPLIEHLSKYKLGLHIMWYEFKLLPKLVKSLNSSLENCKSKVFIQICANYQTYIETPIAHDYSNLLQFEISNAIKLLSKHGTVDIVNKTNSEPFYNIADFRRDFYSNDVKYNIWLESDCLIPLDYFWILDNLSIDEPHILSLSSRKMWDDTWNEVEHYKISKMNRPANYPLDHRDVITQLDLDNFNLQEESPSVVKLEKCKIDGALLALSNNLPQYIPTDMHFAREDTCAERIFNKLGIPQYHIQNRIKGHNYGDPDKRIGTNDTRSSVSYKKYELESVEAMNRFILNHG